MTKKGSWVRKIAVVLMVVMVFAMTACGNKAEDSGSAGSSEPVNSSGKTMVEVLMTAAKNMENAESMTYKFNMDMGMNVFGMKMDSLMDADVRIIQDPLTMEMIGNMDMGDMGSYGMDMYAETENDQVVMYSGIELDGDKTWMKSNVDMDSAELSQYNAQSNIKVYLENAENFSEVGKENVDGVEAVRFDGVVTGESIGAVLEESGLQEQVAAMGVEDASEMYNAMGDIPVSFWVDTENEMIVKYNIDMSESMKNLIAKAMEDAEENKGEDGEDMNLAELFSIDRAVITINITGINNVDSIEIPQDARDNAEEINY